MTWFFIFGGSIVFMSALIGSYILGVVHGKEWAADLVRLYYRDSGGLNAAEELARIILSPPR